MSKVRNTVAALTISGAALVGLFTYEGWVDTAAPPVKGDVPTFGFGTTTHEDGRPVKSGERIDPVRAAQRALKDVNRFEGAIKRCVRVPLHQHEYDAYILLSYNIGDKAFCGSTLVAKLNAGDYAGACTQILRWNKFKGQTLRGLVIRREAEYKLCMGES